MLFGHAAQAAVSLLQPTGGKVHAFLSTLPSLGLHALKVCAVMLFMSQGSSHHMDHVSDT
jgi:hypothetical protein